MKKHVKILSLVLVLLMLVSVFAACGDQPEEGKKEPEKDPQQTDPKKEKEYDEYGQEIVDDGLEDVHFDGNPTVTIITRKEDRYRREYAAEVAADSVDSKIVKRNAKLENQLGVKMIVQGPFTNGEASTETFYNLVSNEYFAQTGNFDIVSSYAYFGVNPTLRDCYKDYYSPEFKYLDLSKPYWNQKYVQMATCFDQLYYLIGDVNLSVWDRTLLLFVNMTMAEDMGYKDLYDTVLDGKWTLEKMRTIIADCGYTEQDGIDGLSAGDKFAVTGCSGSEAFDGFAIATGVKVIGENEDGTHYFRITNDSDMQKFEDRRSAVVATMWQEGALYDSTVDKPMDWFCGNQVLFNVDVLYRNDDVNTKVRSIRGWTFGFLPLPKYEESDEYASTLQDAYNIMSVLDHPELNCEVISAFLELISSLSYQDVRPYYIEKVMKKQYAADDKTAQTLELIFNSTDFDFAQVYAMQTGGVPNSIWRGSINTSDPSTRSMTTQWAKISDSAQLKLADFDTWLMTN